MVENVAHIRSRLSFFDMTQASIARRPRAVPARRRGRHRRADPAPLGRRARARRRRAAPRLVDRRLAGQRTQHAMATCVSVRCGSPGSRRIASGDRTVRIRDVVRGDPHNPNRRRKEQILQRRPDGAQVVVADTAMLSELRPTRRRRRTTIPRHWRRSSPARARCPSSAPSTGSAGRGTRSPSLVREQLAESAAFRQRADELAASLGREPDDVWRGGARVPRRDGHRASRRCRST